MGSIARDWLCGPLLLLLSGSALAVPAGAPAVQLVLSGQSAPYQEFAAGLETALVEGGPRIALQRLPLPELQRAGPAPNAVVVAAGMDAAAAVADLAGSRPAVYTMLPAAGLAELARRHRLGSPGRDYSAVFLDQPYSRQMALIRSVLPHAQRLAVVAGPDTTADIGALFSAASEAGYTLVLEGASRPAEIVPALRHALRDADALLALPDPGVLNRNTVQNVLLTTYRYRVPVFAYSEGLLQAGAAYALFTDPRELGTEVGRLIRRYLAHPAQGLPLPAYPAAFSVGANAHVARSLDLPALSPDQLRRRMLAPARPGDADE